MKKRLLAVLLCVAMLALLMPTSLFAVRFAEVMIADRVIEDGDYWKNNALNTGLVAGSTDDWNVHYESGTLYLKDLNIIGCTATQPPANPYGLPLCYCILANRGLTVDLTGNNTVSTADSSVARHSSAVAVNGDLTITGTGSLISTSGACEGSASDLIQNYGIYAVGTATVSSGSLTGISGAITAGLVVSSGVAVKNLYITGGTVNGYAGNSTGIRDSSGISLNYGIMTELLTVSGGTLIGISGDSTDRNYCESCGVRASDIIAVSGTGTVSGTGGTSPNTCGIITMDAIDISGGTVTAKGGDGPYSFGLWAYGDSVASSISVSGGSLTAESGTASDGAYGIYASAYDVTFSGGEITATADAPSESYGIFCSAGDFIFSAGKLTSSAVTPVAVAESYSLTFPDYYKWRTEATDDFSFSQKDLYTLDGSDPYLYMESYVPTYVVFSSVEANGSDFVETTMLRLTFDKDIEDFAAEDITLAGATNGALTKTGTGVYTLEVSGVGLVEGETADVSVAKIGFVFSPAARKYTTPVVTSITVSPETTAMYEDSEYGFTAAVIGTGYLSRLINWSVSGNEFSDTFISDDGVLYVSPKENVATLTVTAASVDNPTKTDTATVEVMARPEVISVDIVLENPSLPKGSITALSASVSVAGGISNYVYWSVSDNASNATFVDGNGVLTIGSNETSATVNVTATSVANPSKSDTVTVTVLPPEPPIDVTASVSPKTATVEAGSDYEFNAAASGGITDITVVWRVSGNTSKLTKISEQGVLTVGEDETASTVKVTAEITVPISTAGNPKKVKTFTDTATVTVPVVLNYRYGDSNRIKLTGGGILSDDKLVVLVNPKGSVYDWLRKFAGTNTVIEMYDISLQSGKKSTGSEMSLTFNLGIQYAGKPITVLHADSPTTFEVFHATADVNGDIKVGPLYGLSPFMLVEGTLTPTTDTEVDIPDTGVDSQPVLRLCIALLAVSSPAIIAILIIKKRKKV